jgi:hypothetical protein
MGSSKFSGKSCRQKIMRILDFFALFSFVFAKKFSGPFLDPISSDLE